jgi:signal transduction histidine kinase
MDFAPSSTRLASEKAPSPVNARSRAGRSLVRRPAVILFGLAISAVIAGVVHSMLADEARAQTEAMRQSLSAGLQSHIDRKLGLVEFMRGLYDSSDFVSADEFQRFAQLDPDVLDGDPWFSLAWGRRQKGGASDTFPVTYLAPKEDRRARAADLGSSAADRAAMRRAVAARQMTVSAPEVLASTTPAATTGGGLQIKAFMPVFRSGDASPDHLQGFLMASMALNGLFDDFLRHAFTDADFSLRIYDGDVLVFARGPEQAGRIPSDLMVGDQRWRLEIGRVAPTIAAAFWLPALVFVIGLALTSLLYLHLLRADHQYRHISEEVGRATAELAGANARLAERSAALQQVADDLRRTSHEAQLASAAKTMFLANMSHELRTPLNAIIGFAELVAHRTFGDQSPRYFEYAEDIQSSGRYLLSIIEDLLDMSRIELGQVHLAEEAVQIGELVQSVVKFVTHRANTKRIAIQVEGLDGLPRIQADHRALRQALINLLINAIKFSPPGSTVAVQGALEPQGGLALAVQDSGPGIKPEEVARIFEPFWQGDAYRRKAPEGVGLGLAITKRLIEAHGGAVQMESEPGIGTRAIIRLPSDRIIRGRPQLAVIKGGSAA